MKSIRLAFSYRGFHLLLGNLQQFNETFLAGLKDVMFCGAQWVHFIEEADRLRRLTLQRLRLFLIILKGSDLTEQ